MRPARATSLMLAFFAGTALAAEQKACIPGAEQRWICGDAAKLREASASAAALPPPPAPPLPPVLLIDPDRLFGPAPSPLDRGPDTHEVAPSTAPSTAPADATASGTSGTTGTVQPVAAPSAPTRSGSHVWQLARAASPVGFAALRRERGIADDLTRTLQTRRGDWLLLYGDFPSIEAARTAQAQAGPGFARAWSQVESEL